MIMMIKCDDDCYKLIHRDENSPKPYAENEYALLAKLNKNDYDFMLETLRAMRDRNDVGDTYIFPRPHNGVYTVIRINHIAQDHYVIDANLHYIFSDMVDIEFAMIVFDLECLVNHQAQTPAYFPPAKEGSNL